MKIVDMLFLSVLLAIFIDLCNGQECGSVLSGSAGTIKSVGHPASYPPNHDCEWTIEANDNDEVKIRFIDFNVEPGESCEFDSLQVTAQGKTEKFCGDDFRRVGNRGNLLLKGRVVLRLVSDQSVNLRGIYLEYQVIPGAPPLTIPPTTNLPPTSAGPLLATTTPATVASTVPPPPTTCAEEPCQNGGTCIMDRNEFICFCPDGFEGITCEINIDDCQSDPCENGATCVDGVEEWNCQCLPGYIGKTCAIDYDECRSNPCQNGGTCEDQLNSFRCTCTKGWTDSYCSTNIDDCDPNPCQNYGVCQDHLGYHSCICHPSYTGENCTILIETTTIPVPTTIPPTTATTTTTPTTSAATTTTTIATTTTTIATTTTPITTTPTTTAPTTTTATTTTTTSPTTTAVTTTSTVQATSRSTTGLPLNTSPATVNMQDEGPAATTSFYNSTNSDTFPNPKTPENSLEPTKLSPTLSTSSLVEMGISTENNLQNTTMDENSNNTRNETTTAAFEHDANEGIDEILKNVIGAIIGVFLVIAISLIFLLIYLKSSLYKRKIGPTETQTNKPPENHLGKQPMSATSTDSGISPDAEGQTAPYLPRSYQFGSRSTKPSTSTSELVEVKSSASAAESQASSPMEISATQSAFNSDKNNGGVGSNTLTREKPLPPILPSIFSPRSSPVASPSSHLPALKEEIKIIEESLVGASLFPTKISSSTYPNVPPDATLFTFASQVAQKNEAKPKRKRKIAQRSRGPRPKTAAMATRNLPIFDKSAGHTGTSNRINNELGSEKTEFSNRSFLPEMKSTGLNRPVTGRESMRTPKSNEMKGISMEKPPVFLSQIERKPVLKLSVIEKANRKQSTRPINTQLPKEQNLPSGYTQENPQASSSSQFINQRPQGEPVRTSNTNGNSAVINPDTSVPAHSIEEAFESRIPSSFAMQRRRRLAPLTLRKDGISNPTAQND